MKGQWIIKEVYFEDGFPKIIRDIERETPGDRELMDRAWDYLAAYTVGERPNASEVNDLIFALENRLAQPETPDVTPEVTPHVIDCPRCGHCCPQRQWVGLTMLDIAELRRSGLHEISDKHFQAIEAKLREKNT